MGSKELSRDRIIIRTSVIGIIANVFLSAFKAIVGVLSHSIAIVLDAVNNLSDAASSIITIVGTKLAGKPADRKHPFGHGRVEYLTALVIALIVLYAGIASLQESIKKIIDPSKPDYNAAAIVIISVAIAVKIVLGRFVKKTGIKVKSDSLINSGTDALLDSVISATTLIAAVIYLAAGVSLEAYLAALISLVIIKSGFDMLRETISQLLGQRVDADLARDIKKTVLEFDDVLGVYDLVLHNYGPDTYSGSLHIEIPDSFCADRIDVMNREIAMKVYENYNVILTAIGVYSMNTKSELASKVKEDVTRIVFTHENVIQIHGFYLDEEKKTIRFDIIISFDETDRQKLWRHIVDDIKEAYPDYTPEVVLDTDFTES